MFVQKTIVARLYKQRKNKKATLQGLWAKWREMLKHQVSYKELRVEFPDVYSGYARNASFNSRSINDPIILTSQDFRLKATDNRLAKWWVRIPIKARRCVWAALRMGKHYEDLLDSVQLRDSKLVRNVDGSFDLHLTVRKEVVFNHVYSSVLAVDLGERFLATSVLWHGRDWTNTPPEFYGKNARGVRRHYSWLRRRLGERKLLRVIKRIARCEHRKINDILHKISRAIVDEAKKKKAVIVLGLLKGIRNRAEGRRMNRIVGSMPYDRLSRLIEYKASWEGIPVIYTSEAFTSRECHLCHSDGQRPYQGLLVCQACGHQWNADYNGAVNMAERVWEHIFHAGALGFTPMSGTIFCTDTASLTGQRP